MKKMKMIVSLILFFTMLCPAVTYASENEKINLNNFEEMKDIIKGVKCIDYNGKEKILTTEEMQFDYRKSMLVNNKYIVTKVKIELQKGKEEEIKEKMKYSDFNYEC